MSQSAEARTRTIFIAEIEQFGGAERSILAMSNFLFARGLPHQVLTYADHCNFAQYATHPVTVVDLKTGSGARRKIAALKSYMADAIPGERPLLVSGYQPALHATLAGLRGFHTLMHDTPALFGDQDTRSLKDRFRLAVSNAVLRYGLHTGGVTLVNSEFLKADSRRDFGVTAKICRMGGLVSASPSSHAFQRGETLRLLSVCRVEANKRVDWMLRALAALERNATGPLQKPLSQVVEWRLDLAGKGSMIPELQAMAQELGLADRVTFHGFVPDHELEAMYGKAHLFLMPAVQGYGIPAIEALSRGLPVLLHRDSGVSDILLETPWATVIRGGEEGMLPGLADALHGVMTGRQNGVDRPYLPTEAEWAESVAETCGWL